MIHLSEAYGKHQTQEILQELAAAKDKAIEILLGFRNSPEYYWPLLITASCGEDVSFSCCGGTVYTGVLESVGIASDCITMKLLHHESVATIHKVSLENLFAGDFEFRRGKKFLGDDETLCEA